MQLIYTFFICKLLRNIIPKNEVCAMNIQLPVFKAST